jgi:hypothetical protein
MFMTLGVDVVQHRVKRRRLAAAGRPGDQNDAFRAGNHQLQLVELVFCVSPRPSSGTMPFWRSRMRRTMFSPWMVGCAAIRGNRLWPAAHAQRNAAVLWRPGFSNVHAADDLDAHSHRRPVGLVQRADLPQHAVDTVAYAQEAGLRLEVDVGGFALDGVGEDGIDQPDNRLAVFVGRRLQSAVNRFRRFRSRAGCRRSTVRSRTYWSMARSISDLAG